MSHWIYVNRRFLIRLVEILTNLLVENYKLHSEYKHGKNNLKYLPIPADYFSLTIYNQNKEMYFNFRQLHSAWNGYSVFVNLWKFCFSK